METHVKVTWPDLTFPPLNLWNFPRQRWYIDLVEEFMSDGMTEERYERMDLLKKLKETAPYSEHYQKVSPEPIDIIEGWNLNFNLGNVIKYLGRYRFKNQSRADLEKALWYLQREVTRL